MTRALREAALRPEAADLYPFLPAGMWTSVERLRRVLIDHWHDCRKALERSWPRLPAAHFAFRGEAGETTGQGAVSGGRIHAG